MAEDSPSALTQMRVCPMCGKDFVTSIGGRGRGRPATFCSVACQRRDGHLREWRSVDKVCPICDTPFASNRTSGKAQVYCGQRCRRKRANKAHGRRAHLRRQYGITLEEFDRMVLDQEGRCAVCAEPTPDLVVDHCHVTGVVRGLLCNSCNFGLGAFKDRPERFEAAIVYLINSQQPSHRRTTCESE